MSRTLIARNLHHLTPLMLSAFDKEGVANKSRNGNTLRLPGITSVTLTHPLECVCYFKSRDANPFFHLIEAIAMLGAVNSVELLSFFASNMRSFSDDGTTFNAFYGTRARQTWGDQVNAVVRILKEDPDSRQAVVNLWNPMDLERSTKDKACNLMMIFSVVGGCLDMTTFNRSNDAVWGFLTGANMVHLPFFQGYVAASLGLPVGSWHHASANMHVYEWNDKWDALREDAAMMNSVDPYSTQDVVKMNLFNHPEDKRVFDIEIETVLFEMQARIKALAIGDSTFQKPLDPVLRISPFLKMVVVPAFNAFYVYRKAQKYGRFDQQAFMEAKSCFSPKAHDVDWVPAMLAWLSKRIRN